MQRNREVGPFDIVSFNIQNILVWQQLGSTSKHVHGILLAASIHLSHPGELRPGTMASVLEGRLHFQDCWE